MLYQMYTQFIRFQINKKQEQFGTAPAKFIGTSNHPMLHE